MADNLFISNHGLLFRAKLINKFKLIDHKIKRGGDVKNTLITSSQLKNPVMSNEIQQNDDEVYVDSEIDRTVYRPDQEVKEIFEKPRHIYNMVKPTKLQKASLFAHKLNKNKYYQRFMLFVLVLFSLLMGLNVEFACHPDNDTFQTLYWTTLSLVYSCLPIFLFDPMLGYVEDHVRFFRNGWYLLDCTMNLMGMVSCVGVYTALQPKWFFWNIHVFQVFRCIKIIRLVPVVNLLVKAVHQAVKDMLFVLLTLLLVTFVFALAGMVMFAHYEESSYDDLEFSTSFSGLGNAIKTLFNMYTFDTWPKRYREIRKVFGPAGTSWIILWVCVGGYIIRSIFDGVFIYKFQESHQAILQESELEMDREEDENRRDEYVQRLEQESEFLNKLQPPSDDMSEDEFRKQVGEMMNLCITHELSWNKYVKFHLGSLDRWYSETLWPKDTLFSYLQAMESLVENLAERKTLFKLLNEALLSIHDVPSLQGRQAK